MKNKHVMTLFALAMLAYQGWRVIDYMSGSLQGVSDTTKIIVSLAFLAFSEIGLLIWLHVAQPNATTDIQESIANGLIFVDFIGSMFVGLGDLIRHNTFYEIDLSVIDPILFLTPWLMVFFNVGGYLVYAMNDSEAKMEREERRLQHKEHELEMEARRAAMRELSNQKAAIADKLAPHYFKNVHERVTGRTLARFERQGKSAALPTPQAPAQPKAARNGPRWHIYRPNTNGAEHEPERLESGE